MTKPYSTFPAEQVIPSQRSRILEAAADLFGQHGFDGTSFSLVAEYANVKKSLVQYHFENKDILWRETVSQVWQVRNDALPRYLDMFDALGAPANKNIDKSNSENPMIRDLCRRLIQFTFDQPAWVKIMFQESSAPGPRLDWMVKEFLIADFANGQAMIELGQQHNLLPKVDAMDLLHILSGALIYLVNIAPITERVLGIKPDTPAYIDQHVNTLMSILMQDYKT
jgi:TetR/AcrR family transcriptional regulator